MSDKKPTTKITHEPKSQVKIEGEISADLLQDHRNQALENIGKSLKVDGFRPGNIPQHIIEQKAGEMAILDEMAQLALQHWYPQIISEHSIAAIGRPEISITKLAIGNPLEFTITTATLPEVKLGDYKKIAKAANKKDRSVAVEEKEVEEAITQLRKFRAQAQMDEEKSKKAKEAGEQFTPTKLEEIDESDLPELTLEYVQAMGKFESIEDFTEKLRENLEAEKKNKAEEERRLEMLDGILDSSDFEIPDVLVNYEIERSLSQVQHDIAMSGMKYEDYLKALNKDEAAIREDLRPNAEKKARTRLIIETIAKENDLTPNEKQLEKEVAALMEQYKDNAHASEHSIRAYVAEVLLNQAVFDFLDAIK